MKWLKIFRKEKAEKPKTPTFGEMMQPTWDAAFKAYPIGKQFEYLGRKMVVVKHGFYWPGIDGHSAPSYPEINAEYADESGKIRIHKFEATTINTILPNADLRQDADSDRTNVK
jgi:hypothetical protein